MKTLFAPFASRPTQWLVPSLLLALATPLVAQEADQDIQVGGPLRPGHARPPLHVNAGKPSKGSKPTAPAGYSPAQVRHAYGFDALTATGTGQTIALIEAYGDPSIQTELNTFCSTFGIPSATVIFGYPQGPVSQPNSSWALETALDVEWAHAIATNATILLVVCASASLNDLLAGVDYAVKNGATVVSMSWGASEFSTESASDFHFIASGVTFVASSGDNGESTSVEWPAVSPNVVSVGGTTLTLNPNNVRSSETAWSGSGGGISAYEPAPAYQSGWSGFSRRCVPDVSYLADPSKGVQVFQGGFWYVVGGTSVGAPQWAALVALSNSARAPVGSLSSADAAIYSVAGRPNTINSTYFFDVTSGSNGRDPDDFAIVGYDLVTGVGSPVAGKLVPALATH
jgi:subtilase family serine protease